MHLKVCVCLAEKGSLTCAGGFVRRCAGGVIRRQHFFIRAAIKSKEATLNWREYYELNLKIMDYTQEDEE